MNKLTTTCLSSMYVMLAIAVLGCQQRSSDSGSQPTASVEVKGKQTLKTDAEAVVEPSVPNEEGAHDQHEIAQQNQGSMRRGPGGMGRGPGGMGRGPGGMGRGPGGMGRGPGAMAGMRGDMTTLHAMFADRDKITRTVTDLPDGAEAITESEDEEIASLIQEHVPAMEGRVVGNDPLPPMTFHPIFVELIKRSDDYTLDYEDTENGIKVQYASDDPYVVMLVQEHAKLVSRFIKNGMQEIHKPYTLPTLEDPNRGESAAIETTE